MARTGRQLAPADRRNTVGEAVFAPTSPDATEDDGYVMAFLHHPDRGAADLVILAAPGFTSQPFARSRLPARLPRQLDSRPVTPVSLGADHGGRLQASKVAQRDGAPTWPGEPRVGQLTPGQPLRVRQVDSHLTDGSLRAPVQTCRSGCYAAVRRLP